MEDTLRQVLNDSRAGHGKSFEVADALAERFLIRNGGQVLVHVVQDPGNHMPLGRTASRPPVRRSGSPVCASTPETRPSAAAGTLLLAADAHSPVSHRKGSTGSSVTPAAPSRARSAPHRLQCFRTGTYSSSTLQPEHDERTEQRQINFLSQNA